MFEQERLPNYIMEAPARARPVFELTKWYADAVSNYWLGYSLRLPYGAFSTSVSPTATASGTRVVR